MCDSLERPCRSASALRVRGIGTHSRIKGWIGTLLLGAAVSTTTFAAGKGAPDTALAIPGGQDLQPGEVREFQLPDSLRDLRGTRPDDKLAQDDLAPLALPRAGFPIGREALAADRHLAVTDFRSRRPDAAQMQALRAQAASGQVRVIVTLKMLMTPEGLMNDTSASNQRRQIGALQGSVLGALKGRQMELLRQFSIVPQLVLRVDAAALDLLSALPEVAAIQEDVAVPPTLADSVPLIGSADALDRGFSGGAWTVAVLDTGIDRTHPFLRGFVAEACFSATGCPNGQTSQVGGGASQFCTYSPGECLHGTHVSGIATGASLAGLTSLEGVARSAALMPIQVFSRFTGTANCGGSPGPCAKSFASDQMAALQYVFNQRFGFNIAVVNMSLGGGRFTSACDTDPLKPIIDQLRSANIATVIASGNDGYTDALAAPACISSAISVGRTNKDDTIADGPTGSNSSNDLDLLAPGTGIVSSIPNSAFGQLSGTSMSAPHVAGVIALAQSKSFDSVGNLEFRLKATGKLITDTRPGAGNRSRSRIQVLRLLGINEETLANGVARNHRLPRPNPHEYNWTTATGGYSVVATRPSAGLDVDFTLFDVTNFTSFSSPLADSAFSGDAIDFVSLSSRAGDLVYPLVRYFGGGTDTSRYSIEQAGPGAIFSHTLTRSISNLDVVSIADTITEAGRREYFRVVPQSGGLDLDLFVVDDIGGAVQGRGGARAGSAAGGAGEAEELSYVPTVGGRIGLVVLNHDNGGSGNYTLYRDAETTLPVGSVNIDSGAATTTDREVELTLTPGSSGSGIADMRIAVDGVVDDEVFEPFAPSKTVTLPAGDGTKIVAVQFRSNAHAVGPVDADDIELVEGTPQPGLRINNRRITEGNAGTQALKFTVRLSQPSADTVTVLAATANGPAKAGSDYVANSATLTFLPGQTRKSFVVLVNGDTLPEADERFKVNLSNPVGATIADGRGMGTISNDD